MPAWSMIRQLVAAILCVLLVVPASSASTTSISAQTHDWNSAGVYPKTRVWGFAAKNLHRIWAIDELSRELRRRCEPANGKIAAGAGDTYDYDAFGNLFSSTGSTPNNYLFAGEQYDPALGLYYNRARYLNATNGRFWTMDAYEGYGEDPLSLHKYLYSEADPVDFTDPAGRSLSNLIYGQRVHDEIGLDFVQGGPGRFSDTSIGVIIGVGVPGALLRPDLTDVATQQVYEIKPTASASLGYPQLAGYLIVLNRFDPLKRIWIPGATYQPPNVIQLGGGVIARVSPPLGGVIVYEVLNPTEIYALAAIAIGSMAPQLETDFGAAVLETAY